MEVWKDLIGFEGLYEVSNLGRVRSVDRDVTRTYKMMGVWYTDTKKLKGRILKHQLSKEGYHNVSIRDKNRVGHVVRVNRAVAMAFIPNPEGKKFVNHIDHNKDNNSVDNLEWCTHYENVMWDLKNGMRKNLIKNNENPKNKLTWEEVDWIRSHYIPKDPNKKFGAIHLARRFNVSVSLIQKIVEGKARVRNPETDFYPEGYLND